MITRADVIGWRLVTVIRHLWHSKPWAAAASPATAQMEEAPKQQAAEGRKQPIFALQGGNALRFLEDNARINDT